MAYFSTIYSYTTGALLLMGEGYLAEGCTQADACRFRGYGILVDGLIDCLKGNNHIDYDYLFYQASWQMPDFPRAYIPHIDCEDSYRKYAIEFERLASDISLSTYGAALGYFLLLGRVITSGGIPFVFNREEVNKITEYVYANDIDSLCVIIGNVFNRGIL